MMKYRYSFRFYIQALFFGFCVLLSACSNEHKATLKPLNRNSIIVAYGDSLTYGTGAKPRQSYPAVLARLTGMKVINAGVPGMTTTGGLKRLPGVLRKYHPNLVILFLGGNDILRNTDNEKIAANLSTMIRLIQASRSQVVLIAVPSKSLSMTPPAFYQRLAEHYHIPLLNHLVSDLFQVPAYKSDRIHFNAEGYQHIAIGVLGLLQSSGAIQK